MKLNEKQYKKISLTLEIFRSQIDLYSKIMNDADSVNNFMSLNRNPFFDLTNNKFFKTGLLSDEAKKLIKPKDIVHDHFIQRKKSMKILFNQLLDNPNMDVNEFIIFMKQYSSTVGITKEEHMRVTTIAKGRDEYNFDLYGDCGIVVEGLNHFVNHIGK
jgi:hypothetical protein